MAMKKWISLLLGALLLLGSANAALAQENDWIEVDYQTHFIKWDGVTTEEDFTDEAFDALTKTTVYQSDSSPTGYKVTFRFYGPEYETVEVARRMVLFRALLLLPEQRRQNSSQRLVQRLPDPYR